VPSTGSQKDKLEGRRWDLAADIESESPGAVNQSMCPFLGWKNPSRGLQPGITMSPLLRNSLCGTKDGTFIASPTSSTAIFSSRVVGTAHAHTGRLARIGPIFCRCCGMSTVTELELCFVGKAIGAGSQRSKPSD
jgi:hypothetical protein